LLFVLERVAGQAAVRDVPLATLVALTPAAIPAVGWKRFFQPVHLVRLRQSRLAQVVLVARRRRLTIQPVTLVQTVEIAASALG